MKIIILILAAAIVGGCAHKMNLQYNCEPVGKEPKTGKSMSSCE